MKSNHLFLVLFIMLVYGSSYPVGKLGVDNIPPLLFSALRVGLIFLVFLPFFKFKLPRKEMIKPLVLFSLTMGVGTYVSMYFALERLTIVAPIIIGAQLSIPFGILLSYFFLKDNISINRIILIIITLKEKVTLLREWQSQIQKNILLNILKVGNRCLGF